jgi:hypothetical protein
MSGLLLAAAVLVAAEPIRVVEGLARAAFAAQVEAHFAEWDRDQDGWLSFLETSRLVPDMSIRDEAAAALAAIHLVQRGAAAGQAAPLSRSALLASPAPGPGADADAEAGRPPIWLYYQASLVHIRETNRALFTAGAPTLKALHQGLLGDCYFVATLGTVVHRDPAAVGRIVQQRPDGTFEVRFPDGEPVKVAHVSDTEIALGSYAGGQGIWLNVLEKAYGQLAARALARREMFEDAIDALAGGGHATGAVALFTGCDPAVLRFRAEDSPMISSDARVAAFLPMTRNLLLYNLAQRRLTCCGTTKAATPPGLAREHLYAVLDLDRATDLVHVWNPWGNRFEPRGKPGVESGYSTRDGHFSVPLSDFIRIFDSVIYETNRPEIVE